MKAPDILRKSAQHLEDRAALRDQPGGERSMARTVAAFNAATGHQLTERDGWLFMAQLKLVRAAMTPTGIPDDYEDGGAYFALAGEAAAGNDNVPSAFGPGQFVEVAPDGAITFRSPFTTDVLTVPPGYNWIAQDAGGIWYAYEKEPTNEGREETWFRGGRISEIAAGPPNPNWRDTLRQVRP